MSTAPRIRPRPIPCTRNAWSGNRASEPASAFSPTDVDGDVRAGEFPHYRPRRPLPPCPESRRVTGLETWFWYDGQDEVTTTVQIRGYAVAATMRPSR